MPRPILKTPQKKQDKAGILLSATQTQQSDCQMTQDNKLRMDRILRRKRSKEYMEALHQLDAGGHVQNQQEVNEILNVIRSEFSEVKLDGVLLGVVSICYLGAPYDVHTLDMTGNIITHYKSGQPLPNGMEKARGIALRGDYEFVEVYVDCCRAISMDGRVSVIRK